MNKWKCGVCGYIHDGADAPNKCPKCGAPKEKFEKLPDDKAQLVERSRLTNALHQKLYTLLDEVSAVCDSGIADNLDPTCMDIFKRMKDCSWTIKQMIKGWKGGPWTDRLDNRPARLRVRYGL